MKTFLLFYFSLFIWPCHVLCQNNVGKEQVIKQLRVLRYAIAKTKSQDRHFSDYQNRCKTIINDAILNIDSRENGFPYAYFESLLSLTTVADSFYAGSPFQRNELIEFVYNDLSLKFKSNQQTLNNGEFVRLVPMRVVAYRLGYTVNYLRVNYCALAYLSGYQIPDHQFFQLTSPATEEMVPGIYEMWLTRDGDGNVLRRMRIEVDPAKQNHTVEFYLSQK